MERMTGIDPMFIYSDTPETPMEIVYACIFDPATADGGYTFGRVADRLEEIPRSPLPPPAHARPAGPRPPALGGRSGFRPDQPPPSDRPARSRWRDRIRRCWPPP